MAYFSFATQTWPIEIFCNFFFLPYQRLTMPREKKTAENIEVKIPKQWTTANPLMGPEPKANNAKPAIKVVILESKIVAQALSKPIAIAVLGATPLA